MKKHIPLVMWNGEVYRVDGTFKDEKVSYRVIPINDKDREVLNKFRPFLSLETSLGIITQLSFPFAGRKKIGLVLRNELESVLPVPVDEVAIDFVETGNGNVMVACVHSAKMEEIRSLYNPAFITLNPFSALYGLRAKKIIRGMNCGVLYLEGLTCTLFSFPDGRLSNVKHVILPGDDLCKGLLELLGDQKLEKVYALGTGVPESTGKELEGRLGIRVERPETDMRPSGDDFGICPWTVLGSLLLARTRPRTEINLLREVEGVGLPVPILMKFAYVLTFLSILSVLYLHIDLALKQRVLKDLGKEELKIYRSIFPGSPPLGQIETVLKEKIKGAQIRENPSDVRSPVAVLGEISKSLSRSLDVKLKEFVLEEKSFSVSGETTSFAACEKIREDLLRIKDVMQVNIESLETSEGVVKFKMRGLFK